MNRFEESAQQYATGYELEQDATIQHLAVNKTKNIIRYNPALVEYGDKVIYFLLRWCIHQQVLNNCVLADAYALKDCLADGIDPQEFSELFQKASSFKSDFMDFSTVSEEHGMERRKAYFNFIEHYVS